MNKLFWATIASTLLVVLQTNCWSAQPPEGWTHFRGSNGDGFVMDSTLPETAWSNTPALLWKKEIGASFSEVVIQSGSIYTMYSKKTDTLSGEEYIAAFDAQTGNEIWSTAIDDIFIDEDEWGDGPRSTPAIGKNMVFCFSGNGKLTAVDKHSGEIVWQVDVVEQFGSTKPRWGFSSSPRLLGNLVTIEIGGTDNQLVGAFHQSDGTIAWSRGEGMAAYSSPIKATFDSQKKLLFANGSTLYAFDIDGDTLWTFSMPVRSPMTSPLFIAPNNLFLSATNGEGGFLISVTDNRPELIMTTSQMRNDWSSPCHKDGYLYGFNVASLQCVSVADGSRKWVRRGFGKGSLIMINNKLIILGDQGSLTIAEAHPDAYIELSTTQHLSGRSWTAPSYYNGKIYVRNQTHMACYSLTQ